MKLFLKILKLWKIEFGNVNIFITNNIICLRIINIILKLTAMLYNVSTKHYIHHFKIAVSKKIRIFIYQLINCWFWFLFQSCNALNKNAGLSRKFDRIRVPVPGKNRWGFVTYWWILSPFDFGNTLLFRQFKYIHDFLLEKICPSRYIYNIIWKFR